jgi:hypothetical protein
MKNVKNKPTNKKIALDVFLITLVVTSVIAFFTLWAENDDKPALPAASVAGESSPSKPGKMDDESSSVQDSAPHEVQLSGDSSEGLAPEEHSDSGD